LYTDRFTLPFVAQVLIAAAERRRPGLGRWTPEVREELKKVFETEVAEVRARFLELFDDRPYWAKVERLLVEDCFDRYCALAERQTALEQRDYGIWRSGDLLSRVALGTLGVAVGSFLMRAPFIHLPAAGDVVLYLGMLGTPLLPDLQVWMHQRRYRKGLGRIVEDMAAAAEQQKLYQPLPLASGASEVAVDGPARAERSRERG